MWVDGGQWLPPKCHIPIAVINRVLCVCQRTPSIFIACAHVCHCVYTVFSIRFRRKVRCQSQPKQQNGRKTYFEASGINEDRPRGSHFTKTQILIIYLDVLRTVWQIIRLTQSEGMLESSWAFPCHPLPRDTLSLNILPDRSQPRSQTETHGRLFDSWWPRWCHPQLL